jgi:hypothetical protein
MIKKQKEIVVIEDGVTISRFHLSFMYVLILWPIIFLLCFVSQQQWFVGDDGYLLNFSGATGSTTNSSNLSTSNTLLSDTGRNNILWVSFLFALLGGLVIYLLFYYY